MQLYLQNIQVKFVYQSDWVKTKVTGAKSVFVCPVRGWSAFNSTERQSYLNANITIIIETLQITMCHSLRDNVAYILCL